MERFDYKKAFSRNLGWVTNADQEKLANARIAIAGMGGVGGLHLLTLVRLGVTKFHIADMDTFEIENFNRQIGANLASIGRRKVDVMADEARLINPNIEITKFSEGVNSANLDSFLEGVDIFVDGLDVFVLDIRSEIFDACSRKNIPSVTVAPIGMGAALLVFMPGKMTFDEYFGLSKAKNEMNRMEKFILGLAPSGIQMRSLVSTEFFDLRNRRSGSTSMGCSLATGVMGTEVLKIILHRGKVIAAPHGLHFDAYTNNYKKTWLPFGHKNLFFKLKLIILMKIVAKTIPNRINSRTPVNIPGVVEKSPIHIVNISQNGLGIFCDEGVINTNEKLNLKIWLNNKQIDLKVQPIWQKEGRCGLKILEPNDEWHHFVSMSH